MAAAEGQAQAAEIMEVDSGGVGKAEVEVEDVVIERGREWRT